MLTDEWRRKLQRYQDEINLLPDPLRRQSLQSLLDDVDNFISSHNSYRAVNQRIEQLHQEINGGHHNPPLRKESVELHSFPPATPVNEKTLPPTTTSDDEVFLNSMYKPKKRPWYLSFLGFFCNCAKPEEDKEAFIPKSSPKHP